MTDYQSNMTLDVAARLLLDAPRIAITTHAKPDGDAWGSVIALTMSLKKLGKNVEAWFMPPLPENLKTLEGSELAKVWDANAGTNNLLDGAAPTPANAGNLVVVLDTGAWSQTAPMRAVLQPFCENMLIVDHHLAGDIPAKWKFIDPKAASCCEIVAQLLDAISLHQNNMQPAQKPLDLLSYQLIAQALFVGVAADTGWFRFSNTRPFTHELAARLLRSGVDHAQLYQQLEQTDRPEKLALLARAMASLRTLVNGRVAMMVLYASDFADTGAKLEETERIIDIPQSVDHVQVVVLVTQVLTPRDGKEPAEQIRISFRSKPGHNAVNVAQLAATFGGGGHARAAGAKVDAPLDQVLEKLTASLGSAIHA